MNLPIQLQQALQNVQQLPITTQTTTTTQLNQISPQKIVNAENLLGKNNLNNGSSGSTIKQISTQQNTTPLVVNNNGETDEANSGVSSVSGWRCPAPYRCGHCHQVSNWKHVIQVFTNKTYIQLAVYAYFLLLLFFF